jgi:DNA polymerase-3 subunit delta
VNVSKQAIGRTVDQPNPEIRFYLFHGPDTAQSRALGQRLVQALAATKSALAAGTVRSDPASLADEASAMSLFGGARVIWIEPAGEEIVTGVGALLDAASTESPVVAIAGALSKSSPLRKLAEASRSAASFAAYLPEGQDAARMVADIGRSFGLKISPPVADRVAGAAGNDQALVSQELQKLALYLDATPNSPKELAHDAIDAVGTDTAEGDVMRLADLALSGQLDALAEELTRLPSGGSEGIPVVRSLQRRLLMLAPLCARVERGERPDAVMTSLGNALFWKDKSIVSRMLAQWNAERLAKVSDRAGRLERSLIFGPAPQQVALGEELLAIAREARRG